MNRRSATPLIAAALAALAAAPAAAQTFLDQGVLTIERGRTQAGREEFAIRTTPGRLGHPGVLAVATDTYRDREVRAALELTDDHAPVTFQVDVSGRGGLIERISGQFGRGRVALRRVTPQGESVREFPVPPKVAVLDDDGFDQYAFLPRPDPGSTTAVKLLLPRASRVVDATVRALGPDTLTIGSQRLVASQYALTLAAGEERRFWCSAGGELLKVALPAQRITATRTAPPSR